MCYYQVLSKFSSFSDFLYKLETLEKLNTLQFVVLGKFLILGKGNSKWPKNRISGVFLLVRSQDFEKQYIDYFWVGNLTFKKETEC